MHGRITALRTAAEQLLGRQQDGPTLRSFQQELTGKGDSSAGLGETWKSCSQHSSVSRSEEATIREQEAEERRSDCGAAQHQESPQPRADGDSSREQGF